MPEVIDSHLEIAGNEAFSRLKMAWADNSPYGAEVANQLRNFITKQLSQPFKMWSSWIIDDLKLSFAVSGRFDFDGTTRGLTVRLLTQASAFEGDLIPLLKAAVVDIQANGQELPQNFHADIQLTCDRMNAKYGLNL